MTLARCFEIRASSFSAVILRRNNFVEMIPDSRASKHYWLIFTEIVEVGIHIPTSQAQDMLIL